MTKVKVTENGPYILSGTDSITRLSDSKAFEVTGNAALCRCGGSRNKPFCDGAHWDAQFDEDAPKRS